jgi:glycosyltransferase involved in cell wall biosynthesis
MLSKALSHIADLLLPKESSKHQLDDFDPVFYRNCYSDLYRLKSSRALRKHYLLHGLREGRWKNLAEATKNLASRFGQLPEDFNANSYRLLNEDLAQAFDHECQFVFHYLEHGRKEGRRYKVENYTGLDKTNAWKILFRLADFIACAHSWLDEIPQTKEQGIRIFFDAGIERLAPLHLDHIFDPAFYRTAYGYEESATDAALYRHWLEIGVSEGQSANEAMALKNIIASRQYPKSFDWQRYKSVLPNKEAKSLTHRVHVLEHLFKTGFERGIIKHITGPTSDELFIAIGDYHLIRSHYHLAIAAYDRARALNPSSYNALLHRGDAYAALGKTVAAHADFVQSIANPYAPVWSTIHAARTAADNGSFEKSFGILANARPKWSGNAQYRKTVSDIIDQFFVAKTRAAMALYDAEDRHAADACMFGALDEVRGRIVQLEDLPSSVPRAPNGHVAILANQDLAQCNHYRVEQKVRQLQFAGLKAQAFNQHDPIPFFQSLLLGARVAIFYRVPAFPNIIRAILTAKALGIPTYYEVDDLIFEAAHYPDTFESYEGQISKAEYNGLLYGVPLFNYAMGLCEHGIASTAPLASRVEQVVKSHDCLVLRNGLDERSENAIDMGRAPRPKRDTVAIFYGSGTKAHNSDFNEIAGSALLSALEKHANVRLIIVGYLRLSPAFDRFSSRILQLGFVTNLDQYWSLLAASDINLAVLAPGLMASCKSEIKWLEAAVLQVPSIVSGTATYREILEDGIDALIVDNAAAWTDALERLVVDRNLRRSIGAAARRKVLQNYSLENAAKVLRDGLGLPIGGQEFVAPTSATMSTAKLKVLICNVFFPPQSRGGATRVVQDNVDYIKDECPDIDLSVFATDDGVLPPGQFQFDQYRGVPVFRLSTPLEQNMDWRPFNTEHEDVFKRLLDTIQPDLIHFHCIQRLTASIVEIAFRRKIPYLITVHDGWWISDCQFFVDQDDILRLPSSDPFEGAPGPDIPLLDSIARRQRLACLLEGAAQVISVSDAFAEIYRRAGCGNVISIPNGVSQIPPAPRQKNTDGRLSLGHIGGRSAYKGATLVEAVLRTTSFDHLKLTMIDGTMEPGARSERIWGNTPVLLCGPYPQDQVAQLYASFDVLLAPSIWPESFGLVAREAQAQGLWVIASDRGAVAEGIRHGEDGFVIDVSDGRGLTEVLQKLDADVARYQAPPPRERAPMRAAADQGRELAELYRRFIIHGRTESCDPDLSNPGKIEPPA